MINLPRNPILRVPTACLLLLASVAIAGSNGSPEGGNTPMASLAAPRSSDRILVVSPHPDDETIGAGGYLAEAAQSGASIRIVVATDGRKRGGKVVRYAEVYHAMSKLGVPPEDLIFLDIRDGGLSKERTFQRRLEEVSAAFHPNIVIGTHPMDVHPDHAAVGRAIQALGEHSNHTVTAYFFVVHYPKYPVPDAYKPDGENVPPPHLVDTASQWESLPLSPDAEKAKCAAVLEYHSQILARNPLRRGLLISFIRRNEVFAVRSY